MAALPIPPEEERYEGPSFGSPANAKEARRSSEKALVTDASVGKLTLERRDKVRAQSLAEIPWWYSPYGHLASTTGIGLVVLAVSVWFLAHGQVSVRWTDVLVVPFVIVLANYFEWRVHKYVLHKRFWPFEVIYDKHTPMHHMIYVEEDMALRSKQEFRLVLIPAAGVLGIVIGAAPVAIAISRFWSSAAGWLFLLTASLFMVSYEVLHLCYHAPADSFIGRRKVIQYLRAHHAKHHDPRYMQRYNFNVTVPLFDWIMGTMAPKTPPTR